MKRQIEYDDMYEIIQDLKGINLLLLHVEASKYFKGAEEDTIVLRAIRNSLEHTEEKLSDLLKGAYEINK